MKRRWTIALLAILLSLFLGVGAMAMDRQLVPKFQVLDSDGAPLASGKVYTYESGTTTNKTTYQERALSTANANPVILDSRGEADIFFTGTIKIVVKDSDDSTIYTMDTLNAVDVADLQTVNTAFPGTLVRPRFRWKDADEIYIGPGAYHHQGTTEQMVFWDSELTLQLTGLGNNEWRYVAIDDSAIVTLGDNELTANEFTHGTTAPTWSDSKHGQYVGSDRVITAVRTDGSGNVLEFWHDGGDYVAYGTDFQDRPGADLDSTWTDVTLTIPAFALAAQVQFSCSYVDTSNEMFYRPNGGAGTGFSVAVCTAGTVEGVSIAKVLTDTSQILEVKLSADGADTARVETGGWYFPKGM